MTDISPQEVQWAISQIYENYYGVKIFETKDKLNFRCPFCGDSKKNKLKKRGYFYKETGTYHCFNCGHTTDWVGLVSQLRHIPYNEIKKEYLKNIIKNTGTSILKRTKKKKVIQEKKTQDIYINPDWDELNPDCITYLNNRHIFEAPGLDNNFKFYYSKSYDRIVIPWLYNNKLVYYQLRSLRKNQSPKYLFPKGLKKNIFGLDKIDNNINIICFTEGVLDSIFVKNCIAVGGIFPTENQFKVINTRAEASLDYNKKEIIWISDNYWIDSASKKEILKLSDKYPKLKVFKWDKNNPCKDINEWVCLENNSKLLWDESFILKNTITLSQAKIMFFFQN